MPTAIVLSGGGARGDFEVGALRALYNRCMRPDIVCGTSVGAINGAAIAQGEGGLDQLENIWFGLQQNSDMFIEDPTIAALPGDLALFLAFEVASGGIALNTTLVTYFALKFVGDAFKFKIVPSLQQIEEALVPKSLYRLDPIVSVRSLHLDEVWVDVEDGPKWTPTEVSTWGINGHFGAGSR
jgi:hypothetical protein